MEEGKEIQFQSYLESQGLDKESEERLAKEKSERLTRLKEIVETGTAADKMKEIMGVISTKVGTLVNVRRKRWRNYRASEWSTRRRYRKESRTRSSVSLRDRIVEIKK